MVSEKKSVKAKSAAKIRDLKILRQQSERKNVDLK